jgi:glycine cleavage system H protein
MQRKPVPTDLRYNEDHQWLLAEADGMVTVGLTEYGADAFGNIVYVHLPSVDDELTAGDSCGAVESNKTASDLYSPASGHVVAVNEALRDEPSLVNDDPYGAGWLFRIVVTELDKTLTAAEYEARTLSPLPEQRC